MSKLFLKYYIDITRIDILVTIIFGYMTNYLICFGTFGMLITFMVYQKFQNEQYYFYLNHGYTKIELMTKVFAINLTITLLLFVIFK